MASMKERISNVIAWVGFSCLLIMALAATALVYDSAREHPTLQGEPQPCAEITRFNIPLLEGQYKDIVDLTKCARNREYVAKWQYRDKYYGVTGTSSSSVDSLYRAARQIPNYTFRLGEEIAEATVPWALPLWLICIILNYILFGSARLLPWKKAVISEEAS